MVKQEAPRQPAPKATVTVKQEPSDDSGALRTLKRKSQSVAAGGGGVKQENDSKKVKLEGSSGDATGEKKKKKKKRYKNKNKGLKGRVVPPFDHMKWEEEHKSLLECTVECRVGARLKCQQCELQLLIEGGEYPEDHGWKKLDSGLWMGPKYDRPVDDLRMDL